jgi:hypothetical protein
LAAILETAMKYLTDIEIRTLLNLRKTLEIFLGQSPDNNEIISWISVTQAKAGQVEVSAHSVFDEGDTDNLDLYSFTPVDPDEYFTTEVFSTLDNALTFIRDNYKLTELKFVNEGMIQTEYRLLKEKSNG